MPLGSDILDYWIIIDEYPYNRKYNPVLFFLLRPQLCFSLSNPLFFCFGDLNEHGQEFFTQRSQANVSIEPTPSQLNDKHSYDSGEVLNSTAVKAFNCDIVVCDEVQTFICRILVIVSDFKF